MSESSPKPKRPPRPIVAARGIVVHNERVLFLRAADPGRTIYFLPGGGARHAETLADTVAREIKEETNVSVVVERPLYLREFIAPRHQRLTTDMPADRHVVALVFLCRPDESVHGNEDEIGEFPGHIDAAPSVEGIEWLSREQIEKVEIVPPHIKQALLNDFPPADAGVEYWPDID